MWYIVSISFHFSRFCILSHLGLVSLWYAASTYRVVLLVSSQLQGSHARPSYTAI